MHLRAAYALLISLFTVAAVQVRAQQPDAAAIIRDLDAANQSRFENVLGFTDVEHYSVFRGKDETHPAAEMTVRVTYKKGTGKSYEILSQSGSSLVQRFGLQPLLDNEKALNDPATVAQTWFTSANYHMQLRAGAPQIIDGHRCLALDITPHRKAPNMLQGTLWVDAHTHMQIEVDGFASKNPSPFSGPTRMMRHYADMQGYAMATHARAESSSFFFGRTVVIIDYSDYHFEMRPAK